MGEPQLDSIPLARKIVFVAVAITLGLAVVFAFAEMAARLMVPKSDGAKVGVRLADSARLFGLASNHRAMQIGVRVETNSLGFREREYALERDPRVTRVAILGDSYTFGTGVPFDEIYSKRLEKRLNQAGRRFEVVNFGVPGYNTTLELATWREVASKFRPDIVVLGYVLNDTERYSAEGAQAGAAKPSLVNAAHVALKDLSMFYRYVAPKLAGAAALVLGDRYAVSATNQVIRSFEDTAPGWMESREALATLAREVRQSGASFLVVVFPMMLDFSTYPLREAHARVVAFCRENGIEVMDLLPALEKQDVTRLTVVMDGHPNARAHEIFAERIFERFMEREPPEPRLLQVRR